MRLMLAQTDPVTGDIAANLSALEGLCRQAEAAGADLLALPELHSPATTCLTASMSWPTRERWSIAWRRWHASIICMCCSAWHCARPDGRLTNSAVLLDDEGHQLACYHKRQLWDREHRYFAPGDELCVVDTRLGKLGLMICYDNEFPEMARALAQAGAEVILSPTANMVPNADRQQLQIRGQSDG